MSLRHTESDENGCSGGGGLKTGATLESIPEVFGLRTREEPIIGHGDL
jgi:hypothetical protein